MAALYAGQAGEFIFFTACISSLYEKTICMVLDFWLR